VSFAALPVAWIAAIAGTVAAAVIGIYLLRPTPRHHVVSNVGFWLRAVQRSRPRLLISRRVPLIALLVTLLIALAFVFELGDPRLGRGQTGTTIYVIDADRSMGARFAGARRIDAAVARVRQRAQQDTLAGQVGVLRAGLFHDILIPLTSRPADVERSLITVDPDDGPADLSEALARADRIVRESGQRGRIVLLTGRPLPPESRRGLRSPVEVISVGNVGETVAVTQLGVRRDPNAIGEYAVYCEVRAFTSRNARARLVLRDRAVVISEERVSMAPGASVVHRAQGFSSAQGEITARLEDIQIEGARDSLPSDDFAFATVDPLVATRVLLVTDGDPFLVPALETNPSVALTRMTTAAFTERRRDPRFAAELAQQSVLILDRFVPSPPVDHPAQILVAPPNAPAFANLRVLQSPRITAYAMEHPVLAGVRFDQVRVAQSLSLIAASDDRVLVRAGRDTIVMARDRPGARLIVFGFPMPETDLVRRIAFPLLIHNAVVWLDRRETPYRSWQQPGEPVHVPRGTSTVLLPNGRARDVRAGAFFETGRAGIYHAGTRAIAVSAVDTVGPLTSLDRTRGPGAFRRPLPPLSVLVAAGLLAFMLLEWVLTQRGKLP